MQSALIGEGVMFVADDPAPSLLTKTNGEAQPVRRISCQLLRSPAAQQAVRECNVRARGGTDRLQSGHPPLLGLTVGTSQLVPPPRIWARLDQGRTPCSSVTPYDSATSAATSQRPVNSKTRASAASAATARPTNSGVSRLASFSKYWMLAITLSSEQALDTARST